MGATRRAAASRWLLMMLCDPGTARFKSVYMQAWVRESMIKNNPDKSRRRGGWKVKPRQYIRWRPLDEDIMCRKDYWEWDTEKCNWWSLSIYWSVALPLA